MNNNKKISIALWVNLILFLAVWFYMLGARTLMPTDEGRYAEMAREMAATGDWITPRLNGIKYFEKPPLQTWMNALTFKLFGLGEWQARLWTGLTALFGIFLVGYTGTRLASRRTGITAAVMLASCFWWSGLGHMNTLDMGLSGMLTLVLCGFLLAQHDQASKIEQRNWMLLCWLGMALATLSKGLIGIVLPGSALILYTLLARDWRIWQRVHLFKGMLLFSAVTVPWFLLVAKANPEFLHFFFIQEHWQRYTSKIHRRFEPWYFFIPLLIAGIFPWLGLLLQSVWVGAKRQISHFQPGRLLVIWAVFIFCFFSISNSKLLSYILPIFPALALLIAFYLERTAVRSGPGGPNLGLKISCGFMALLGICLVVICMYPELILGLDDKPESARIYEAPLNHAYLPYIGVIALLMIFSSIAAWIMTTRQRDWAIWILAWAGFLSGQLILLGHEPWDRYMAGTNNLPAMQAELSKLPPDTTIYAVKRYEQSLPFYLRRTLVLVEHPDEMEFGLEHEPQLWVPTRAEFIQRWQDHQATHTPALAIVDTNAYRELVEQGVLMRVVAQDPRRVIVSSQLVP